MKISNPIFRGIGQEEYDNMLSCGGIRLRTYSKGAAVFHAGDQTSQFGILLSGKIHIESGDLWGNRVILHQIEAGQAFAESYAFCSAPMMVDVTAVEESSVLFLDLDILLSDENQGKSWYVPMLKNLLLLCAGKNLAWSGRVFCLSAKGVRARIMTYLSSEAVKRGSRTITIPFDRQQMADYLNVERSALSKELGRMEKEGILTFHKNQFRLLNRSEKGE